MVEVLPDDEHPVAREALEKDADDLGLRRVLAGEAELVLVGLAEILPGEVFVHADAHFEADGLGDEILGLEFLPRQVELLADEGEDVAFVPVLAHERGGEAQAALGLDAGHGAEDRRGQQVDLVVDDEAPVGVVEEVEVSEGVWWR